MPAKEGGRGGSKAPSFHSKLRRLGLLESRQSGKSKQLTFVLYFPRPPYRGAQYRAARGKDGLYNFVGLVLGHGGGTVQRIQKSSGAKIEVRDSAGNLNGAHPSSHGDPTLHAWVSAANRQRLDKAVALLLEVLQPTNSKLRKFGVDPGGSVVLEPEVPGVGPASAGASQEAAEESSNATPASPPSAPSANANAWDSKRLLLKPRPDGRQMSPTSTLERHQAAAAIAESCAGSDTDDAEAGAGGGQESRPLLPPPPPPPPRGPAGVPPMLGAASPRAPLPPLPAPQLVDGQQQPLSSAAPALQPMQTQPTQQHPAAMWAGGLHLSNSNELPARPAALDARHMAPEPRGPPASWSLWDGLSSGPTFYEQLQAAASGALYAPGRDVGGGAALGVAPPAPMHALPTPAPASGHVQPHFVGLAGPAGQPEVAPFPGLTPRGMGLPVGLPQAQHAARPRLDAESEMQQLLAAITSLATHDL